MSEALRPRLISSDEGYDRGVKFAALRQLPSLRRFLGGVRSG